MNDQQLLRYSRHILLPEIGIEGQQRLLKATALIIGVGGLGSPIAIYLAAAGVGKIILCDDDKVSLTNLQRQIIHRTTSLDELKVDSARAHLKEINPETEIITLPKHVSEVDLITLAKQADVVIDASDNFTTRYAVNKICAATKKPLISGAAIQFDGQVSVFDMRYETSACYQCLFPEQSTQEETLCSIMGVFSPLVGIIGTIQASEALKLLIGMGETLNGRLLLIDALRMSLRTVKLSKDPACTVCSI